MTILQSTNDYCDKAEQRRAKRVLSLIPLGREVRHELWKRARKRYGKSNYDDKWKQLKIMDTLTRADEIERLRSIEI